MKIIGIEHVAVAVESLEESAFFWGNVLGIPHRSREEVKSERVMTDIYDTGKGKVELLAELGDDSSISTFLKRRGPGIHHLCLEVDDILEAIDTMKNLGIRVVKNEPSVGAEGHLVVFVHPESTGGVLVELCEKP